jgi:uncharacterized secreted protein with C-terminal beta-propeller domain
MKKLLILIIVFITANLMTSCQSEGYWLGATNGALRLVEDCEDLESTLRNSAYKDMQQRLEQNLDWALSEGYCFYLAFEDYDDASKIGGSPPPRDGAEEYSTTNTQEVGVDEADFVKNDGNFIYLLAGQEFLIFQAWPAEETSLLSTTALEGKPTKLYVHDDKAVVYCDLQSEDEYYPEHEYYYWDYYYPPKKDLKIFVFDIEQKEQPSLLREISINGSYLNSRRIDDAIHTAVVFDETMFPGVKYWPDNLDCGASQIEIIVSFELLLINNKNIIENTPLEDWLPTITDLHYSSDQANPSTNTLVQNCQNYYEPVVSSGHGFLSIVSLDLEEMDHLEMNSIMGKQGEVYASSEALYIATSYNNAPHDLWYFDTPDANQEATVVHKFSLDYEPAATDYQASGVVRGRVLNQFSMGEHENNLRIATTSGMVWNPETNNSVFVLQQNESVLEVIGSITGIAPTEDIRSARFTGDKGFIVTFKKTDPLYTIDLSDPTNPQIMGELKIPGFSTYIHMMDDDHLLTIGFDADDQGSFAWFQGIQLQIFDVSNMSDPTQIHSEIIGTRGTSSEATANHLAFNYFGPKNLLALPMAICEESSGGGSYGDQMAFSGLMVWDVTIEDGFSEHGRVEHLPAIDDEDYVNDGCNNWWTQPNSRVKRSIIMDDYVFSISNNMMKVNHLNNLETDILAIELPSIPSDDPYYNW